MEDVLRNVPGIGPVNFPDSMKGEDIDAAVERLSKEATGATTPTLPQAAGAAGDVPVPALRSPMVQGGRGTQLNVDKYMQASDAANTPLLHTGAPTLDRFTTPIALVAAAGGGAAVLRAGLSGGFSGAGWEAFTQAAPQIRYEIIKSVLERGHIPGAGPIALALSMWTGKGGGAKGGGAVAEPAPPPEPASPIPGTGTSSIPASVPPAGPQWTATPPTASSQGAVAASAPSPAPVRTGTAVTPASVPQTGTWPVTPPTASGQGGTVAASLPVKPSAPPAPPIAPVGTGTPMTPGAVPQTSWQGNVGAFINQFPRAAESAAESAAAKGTPTVTASTVERATNALTDAGMSAARAGKVVASWTRQGVTDLVRAAEHYADTFLKD
jgi:hypothetical protein